jgi:hypothetical protein
LRAKRLARRLLGRELVEFAIVDREKAKYVAHILESLGAKTEIRFAGGRVAGEPLAAPELAESQQWHSLSTNVSNGL